jgi:hypothetical protein
MTTPPASIEGFGRFIEWARQRRADGQHASFAIVPDGSDTAVGLIQFHAVEATSAWPSGLRAGVRLVGQGPVHGGREAGARVRVRTRRGAAHGSALGHRQPPRQRRPAQARGVCETELRLSFAKGPCRHNQYLWSILEHDWRRVKLTWDRGTTLVH